MGKREKGIVRWCEDNGYQVVGVLTLLGRGMRERERERERYGMSTEDW